MSMKNGNVPLLIVETGQTMVTHSEISHSGLEPSFMARLAGQFVSPSWRVHVPLFLLAETLIYIGSSTPIFLASISMICWWNSDIDVSKIMLVITSLVESQECPGSTFFPRLGSWIFGFYEPLCGVYISYGVCISYRIKSQHTHTPQMEMGEFPSKNSPIFPVPFIQWRPSVDWGVATRADARLSRAFSPAVDTWRGGEPRFWFFGKKNGVWVCVCVYIYMWKYVEIYIYNNIYI